MKILQINTSDIGGGAERVAYQINNALNKINVQSDLLVGKKSSDNPNVYILNRSFFQKVYSKAIREIFSLQGFFSHSTTTKVLHIVEKYDIVHYHNLHGNYFNIKDVGRIAKIKPAVWTLHDMWSFTGRCSFAYDCDEWLNNCGKCNDKLNNHPKMNFDNSKYVFNMKNQSFVNDNIHIVTPSKWLEDYVKKSFLKNLDIRTIYNGVDTEIYKFNNKTELRKKYCLNPNKMYLLFISADINDPRKGFRYLINALKRLKDKKDIVLLAAGKEFDADDLSQLFEIHQFGYVTDERKLNEIYSLADVFITPTLSDNFPCTILECMASGTPVISFDVGGIKEQITDDTGWLVEKGNEDQLKETIEKSHNNLNMLNKLSQNSAERAKNEFSLNKCIYKYKKLYDEILNQE